MSAYLTFENDSNGKVVMTWSKTPVPNALISATPATSVPQFKFSGGGKNELVRGANDSKKFYQGVCSFVKQVAVYKSVLKLESGTAPTSLLTVLLSSNNTVFKLEKTPIDLKDKKSVAAVSKDCIEYNAKILSPGLFLSKASTSGGYSENLI